MYSMANGGYYRYRDLAATKKHGLFPEFKEMGVIFAKEKLTTGKMDVHVMQTAGLCISLFLVFSRADFRHRRIQQCQQAIAYRREFDSYQDCKVIVMLDMTFLADRHAVPTAYNFEHPPVTDS